MLVRVFFWALLWLLWIVFVGAQMDDMERICNVGDVQALPREGALGIFVKLFGTINAYSAHSEDNVVGTLSDYGV
jgi:hypothetical protein